MIKFHSIKKAFVDDDEINKYCDFEDKDKDIIGLVGSIYRKIIEYQDGNERFYKLISKFYEKTGVPVLLNTSFNGPREPIVETPFDALNCFVNQRMDVLVLGDYIITRNI